MSPQLSAVKPGQKSWMTGPLVNPGEKAELKVTETPANAKTISHAARQPQR
jgi:hypothetical protein